MLTRVDRRKEPRQHKKSLFNFISDSFVYGNFPKGPILTSELHVSIVFEYDLHIHILVSFQVATHL